MTRRMHLKKDSRGNYVYEDEPMAGLATFPLMEPCRTIVNLEPCHKTQFEHIVADFAKAVKEGKPYRPPEPKKKPKADNMPEKTRPKEAKDSEFLKITKKVIEEHREVLTRIGQL